ncbi:hypothetical protein [Chlorogloeopsis sp. ULAP02]|uniref:hypothetical protein n=1 Tax=Chlorogloeopsis sp. ULAP02 TaxID=3107926 RepID=UPI00398AEFA7
MSQPDKWSPDMIAARSKARPWQMDRLKMAEQLRENPGVEFMMECWADDPASADCDQEIGGEMSAVGIGGGRWGTGEVAGVALFCHLRKTIIGAKL